MKKQLYTMLVSEHKHDTFFEIIEEGEATIRAKYAVLDDLRADDLRAVVNNGSFIYKKHIDRISAQSAGYITVWGYELDVDADAEIDEIAESLLECDEVCTVVRKFNGKQIAFFEVGGDGGYPETMISSEELARFCNDRLDAVIDDTDAYDEFYLDYEDLLEVFN